MDLGLYLNTHPTETEAINAYNQTIEAADTLRMKFEAAYGPLCSFRSYAADTENWQWKTIHGLANNSKSLYGWKGVHVNVDL